MNKFDFGFFIILFICPLTLIYGQTTGTNYEMPAVLPLIRDYNPYDYLVPQFYPFGWSENGKFAYILKTEMQGRGGYIESFVILDTITDDFVWYKSFDSVEDNDRDLIFNNFKRQMQENKIIQSEISIREPPVKTPDDTITFEFSFVEKKFPDSADEIDRMMEGYYESYTLFGYSQKRGKKKLTHRQGGIAISIGILGYIKSPFEERVIVIVKSVSRGWEGPPNPVDIDLIGCHLKSGFK